MCGRRHHCHQTMLVSVTEQLLVRLAQLIEPINARYLQVDTWVLCAQVSFDVFSENEKPQPRRGKACLANCKRLTYRHS